VETINSSLRLSVFVILRLNVYGNYSFGNEDIRRAVESTPGFWQEGGKNARVGDVKHLKDGDVPPNHLGVADSDGFGTLRYYRFSIGTGIRPSELNAFRHFMSRLVDKVANSGFKTLTHVSANAHLEADVWCANECTPESKDLYIEFRGSKRAAD
jgi:hypothetical protein